MIAIRPGASGINEGDKFGKLTAIGPPFIVLLDCGVRKPRVVCRCECGKVFAPLAQAVKVNDSVSCGCSGKDIVHKLSSHPLYNCWRGMISRCSNQIDKSWDRYGGRGISVCQEWRDSIVIFYYWAIKNGWKPGLQLDRRNNNGNYEPLNCRFVERVVNSNNTRKSVLLTAFGETKSASQWSRDARCRVSQWALYERLEFGWDHEAAIATPPNARPRQSRRLAK